MLRYVTYVLHGVTNDDVELQNNQNVTWRNYYLGIYI